MPHRRETLRYLDTQLRSASPEYVFGILNEELTRLLLQLQAALSTDLQEGGSAAGGQEPKAAGPGNQADLREKIEAVLDELVRVVESRPGTPFTELSDLYRSFQLLLVTPDRELFRSLPEMTSLLIDLIGKLRPGL